MRLCSRILAAVEEVVREEDQLEEENRQFSELKLHEVGEEVGRVTLEAVAGEEDEGVVVSAEEIEVEDLAEDKRAPFMLLKTQTLELLHKVWLIKCCIIYLFAVCMLK